MVLLATAIKQFYFIFNMSLLIRNDPNWRHMSDTRNENTDKKGTCVYEKDIHVSYKGQGADLLRCLLKQTFLV
jgi:hypothetical protein